MKYKPYGFMFILMGLLTFVFGIVVVFGSTNNEHPNYIIVFVLFSVILFFTVGVLIDQIQNLKIRIEKLENEKKED